MEETQQLISLFHTGFIICLVLTILFAALSIFLFFFLRIRNVFDNMTGRAEKRTIRMMEEENAKTGKLRQDYLAANTSGSLYTTPSGNIPPVVYTPPNEDDGSAITERPYLQSGIPGDGAAKTERTHLHKNSPGGVMQTVPQTPAPDGSEATTLLDAGGEATTILDQGGEATTLLNQGEGGEETTLLNQKPALGRYGLEGAPGETVLLTPQMEKEMAEARDEEEKKKFPGKFVITKEQIWIHTEELI